MKTKISDLKIAAILFVLIAVFFPADPDITVKNPFVGLEDLNFSYFYVAQDSSLDVWLAMDRKLFRYSKQGFKEFDGEEAGVIRIWGFDKVYALCERSRIDTSILKGKQKLRRPDPASRFYTLETVENGEFKVLEESPANFAFHRSLKGDRILINTRGEIIINGKVEVKLDVSKDERSTLDINAISFSETVPGNVWAWAKESKVHKNIFGKNVFLIRNGKVEKVSCEALGLAGVYDIIEPEEGTVYFGQYYDGYKCAKISYKEGKEGLEVLKDSNFDETSFVPVMHQLASDGKLWMLSREGKSGCNELSYYFENKFVKFASDAGVNYYLSDSENFMLVDHGYVWLSKGEGQGVNLIFPDGKVHSFDLNQGIRVETPRQILKLPDGNILLVNANYGRMEIEEKFQVLKGDSYKILSALNIAKYYEEFSTYEGILHDSKGNYYWNEKRKNKSGTLCKFDGTKTVDLLNAYDFRKEKETEKVELLNSYFLSYGMDSDDKLWLIFGKREKDNDSKYAVILKADGTYELEELKKLYLKKCRNNKDFQVKFMSKSIVMLFEPPNTVFFQTKTGGFGFGKKSYTAFKEVVVYTENEKSGKGVEKVFKGLEENEYFMSGFNRTKEGKLYLTTWSGFSQKRCYIYEKNEWKESGLFYPNKHFEVESKEPEGFEPWVGSDSIGRAVKFGFETAVFSLKPTGLYMKKGNTFWKFKDIPGALYSGADSPSDGFFDSYGNCWISSGSYLKAWVRIKKDDIPKVTEKIDPNDLIRKEKVKAVGKMAAAATQPGEKRPVLAGIKTAKKVTKPAASSGFTEVKEVVKGELITVIKFVETKNVTINYEAVFKKLLTGKAKEILEAEKSFIEGDDEAIVFLETKKGTIKDEKIVWKIEAMLSRIKK